MSTWEPSDTTEEKMKELVESGLFPSNSDGFQWRLLDRDRFPSIPVDRSYVVLFCRFHEGGLALPAGTFFRGLLYYYGLELQHLNPNGILQIALFIALCERFLGIAPHFGLWRYFFHIRVEKRRDH